MAPQRKVSMGILRTDLKTAMDEKTGLHVPTDGVPLPQFNTSSIISRKCVKIRAISITGLWNTQLFAAVPIHKTKLIQQ
jgi:hypothetical protein